jgi:hypothetical protein
MSGPHQGKCWFIGIEYADAAKSPQMITVARRVSAGHSLIWQVERIFIPA